MKIHLLIFGVVAGSLAVAYAAHVIESPNWDAAIGTTVVFVAWEVGMWLVRRRDRHRDVDKS